MKQPMSALARSRINGIYLFIRLKYYGFLGLKLGLNNKIGRIHCDWPRKVSIGSNCQLEDGINFWFKNPFDENNFIRVGNNVFIGRNCEFNCNTSIIIEDNCLIANNCTFADINHQIKKGSLINQQPCNVEQIVIKEDVWIGVGAIILKGVTLGKGCVIAAGSVVNKSIPDYEIWGGVPAKPIGARS